VASRPLRVKELAEVFAFDFEAGAIPELREDWREDDPVYAVLSACSSLLAVVNVEDTQVIQFSHFSVKEFLTSDRLLQANDTISGYHISMTPAHTLVARVCLGTLLHLPEDVTNDSLETFPLAEYAAEHWVDHARFEDVSQDVEDGMKELFDPRKSHLSVWVWIHDPEVPLRLRTKRGEIPSGLRGTALHYAALCGLHRIVKWLITEHSQDVHALGFDENSTPLHSASSGGHVELARLLLEHGAVATAKDWDGLTPLHCASSGDTSNSHGSFSSTALSPRCRAGKGRLRCITRRKGDTSNSHGSFSSTALSPQRRKTMGWTPLHCASDRGHTRTRAGPSQARRCRHGAGQDLGRLRCIGRRPGDTSNSHVSFSSTALSPRRRTGMGRLRCIGRRSGDTSNSHWSFSSTALYATAQDGEGSTPLHWASSRGHVELARVLLEHGAVATAQDGEGSTPLDLASSGGHVELAQVLLEHGAVATAQYEDGSTPLHRASSGGHLELARVLLEHGAVATARDGNGSTPLDLASSKGHLELAQVLLQHGSTMTDHDI
jgi:ankyrin repeat protein